MSDLEPALAELAWVVRGCRMPPVGPRTFRPSIWGKLATATYIVTSVVVMYFNYQAVGSVLVESMIWLSLVVTVVSSADYFLKLRKII